MDTKYKAPLRPHGSCERSTSKVNSFPIRLNIYVAERSDHYFVAIMLEEVSHLVIVCILHEISARSNVGGVLALGDELESKRVTRSRDAICTTVIRTLDGTVLCTGCVVWTSGGVPLVSIEAVGVSIHRMEPSPVGVDDNFSIDVGTATTAFACAALPGHLRMGLCLLFADDPARCAIGAKSQNYRHSRS